MRKVYYNRMLKLTISIPIFALLLAAMSDVKPEALRLVRERSYLHFLRVQAREQRVAVIDVVHAGA